MSHPAASTLAGRVALITGAAGAGVGGATARRLAREGASIAVLDIHERRTQEIVAALQSEYDVDVVGTPADIASRPALDAALERIRGELGPIDILVNNAALTVLKPLTELEPEEWDRVLATDLSACFYLTKRLLPDMLGRGRGAIVNVCSVASFGHLTGQEPAYAAAKAGLAGLTRSTAIEGGPRGVRCNGVAPGLIQGRFMRANAERFRDQLERTPLRRFAEPEDVANVIHFLCSDESRHITGEIINVSGGVYLR